jgi:deoxyadenosine/deoxycytidine kinase
MKMKKKEESTKFLPLSILAFFLSIYFLKRQKKQRKKICMESKKLRDGRVIEERKLEMLFSPFLRSWLLKLEKERGVPDRRNSRF